MVRIVRRGEGTPPYGCGTWRAVQMGRRGRRPLRSATRNAADDERDDVGIIPYG